MARHSFFTGVYTMATYAEIQAQILSLQQQAEMLRRNELQAVIDDIKAKIAQFGLSARDLGLDGTGSGKRGRKARARPEGSSARFVGPAGQTWSGFGRQPQWLRDALASGKRKEDFAA